ncbi:MAG: hypothetical protein RJB66_460 [Pseudomonadota bacterium]|jgi:hypothetical protein
MKLMSVIFIFALANQVHAETVIGQVFKKDSNRKELLYNFKNEISDSSGVTKASAHFSDLSGQVAVEESSERQGAKLKRYDVTHRQTGRKGSIVVDGSKVIFNFEDNGSKKEAATETFPENFVVGHTLAPYVATQWQKIVAGETVDIRFGVWDRQETVGFSLFKVGQEKLDGRDVVLLKFKPTSFVIAALVDPVIFKFSNDGKELLGMIGRVAPKRKDGSKWKDLDAEVIYKNNP